MMVSIKQGKGFEIDISKFDSKSIGQNIKKIRKSKGLSQKELADLVNVSQSAIYYYESGKREIKWDMILKIAVALKTPLDQFVEVKETEEKVINQPSLQEIVKNQTIVKTNNKYFQKLTNLFARLNETGQQKAVEQIELLTKIQEYKKDPNVFTPIAAHNDNADDEEQQKLMKEDIDEL